MDIKPMDQLKTTSELKRTPKAPRPDKKLLAIAIILVIGLLAGGYVLLHMSQASKTNGLASQARSYFPATITKSQINIPVYYPVGLPGGWGVSGFSVLKQNVLYYVVTSNRNNRFYVTIQPLPTNFDFVGFAKKFSNPDQYFIPIGNALVGFAGPSLIGSIQTNTGSWIILSSASSVATRDMETLTRAFRPVSL